MSFSSDFILLNAVETCKNDINLLVLDCKEANSRWLKLRVDNPCIKHNAVSRHTYADTLDMRDDPLEFKMNLWIHMRLVKIKIPLSKKVESEKKRCERRLINCKARLFRLSRLLHSRSDVLKYISTYL